MIGEGNFSKVYLAKIRRSGERVALKLIERQKMLRLRKSREVQMEKHCFLKLFPEKYRDATTTTFSRVNSADVGRSFSLSSEPAGLHASRESTGAHAADSSSQDSPNRCDGGDHIIKLLHTYSSDLDIALITEWVDGDELWDTEKFFGIACPFCLKAVCCQVLRAMKLVHSRQIVHRDIKAENLILDSKAGIVKVIDFGSALDLSLAYESTLAGQHNPASHRLRSQSVKPEQVGGGDEDNLTDGELVYLKGSPRAGSPAGETPMEDSPLNKNVLDSNQEKSSGRRGSPKSFSKMPRERSSEGSVANFAFFVGSSNFMAPEARHNRRVVDCTSDIWSFGCLLYQLYFGFPPFQAPSDFLVFARASFTDLDLPVWADPNLVSLILRCIVTDQTKRVSLDELLGALQVLSHQDDEMLPPPGPRRLPCGCDRIDMPATSSPSVQTMSRLATFYVPQMIAHIDSALNTETPKETGMLENEVGIAENGDQRLDVMEVSAEGVNEQSRALASDKVINTSATSTTYGPAAQTTEPDVQWMRLLIDGDSNTRVADMERLRSAVSSGSAVTDDIKQAADKLLCTPASRGWQDFWSHLGSKDQVCANEFERGFVERLAAARYSRDVEDIVISVSTDSKETVASLNRRRCRAILEGFARLAFSATVRKSTGERSDTYYENLSKKWLEAAEDQGVKNAI